MQGRSCRTRSVFRSKRNDTSTTDIALESSFDQLRTATKRLAIMSRMETKELGRAKHKAKGNKSVINKTTGVLECEAQRRPLTTKPTLDANNINAIIKAYQSEKQRDREVLGAVEKPKPSQELCVKQGLLGEYQRYNEMSKHELIQKLISLEYLANSIFKKNKALEDTLRKLTSPAQTH